MGVIPGPKKPWDCDSFLWPMIQEFLQLAIGVTAYDVLAQSLFLLRAYLIIIFGDIPALAMLMRMKGHNAILPCRMCEIIGVRIPNAPQITTHYVPLHRRNHPDTGFTPQYNPSALPLRTHDKFIKQAKEVQFAPNQATAEKLAKKYGIKGILILTCLSSLAFPLSAPFDFMHEICENILPNLRQLWTGTFKGLKNTDGAEDYILDEVVWKQIGAACATAGNTIPAAFGSRVPDVAAQASQLTAETEMMWALLIAPTLLRGRFKKDKYYKHFLDLVKLINLCLEFELTVEMIDEIDAGFKKWVQDYE